MALSTPSAIENRGDAWRLSDVGGAFIVEVSVDRRPERHCHPAWQQFNAHCQLHTYDPRGRLPYPTVLDFHGDPRDMLNLEHERRLVWLFVQQHLKLDMPWVAAGLVTLFRAGLHMALHPEDPQMFAFAVTGIPVEFPTGQKPPHQGASLKAAVRHYWRIRTGEVSKKRLAKDLGWTRSRVQNDYQQVQTFLDLITAHSSSWRPSAQPPPPLPFFFTK
jgi:hypothetical protein